MLFSLDSDTPIARIPHADAYRIYRDRLTGAQYQAITDHLNERIDGGEVHTSSWLPGSDWTGTVFQPIYDDACRRDQQAAARCFGLILWDVMMQRPEAWAFGRYEANGAPIEGLTYFRIADPRAAV